MRITFAFLGLSLGLARSLTLGAASPLRQQARELPATGDTCEPMSTTAEGAAISAVNLYPLETVLSPSIARATVLFPLTSITSSICFQIARLQAESTLDVTIMLWLDYG